MGEREIKTDYMYRDLTSKEQKQAAEQLKNRTRSEKMAYHLLPESMKENVERNPAVAFVGCNAYYPDLLLRKAKICIEIDGGYHCRRKWYDSKRDNVFKQHGFTTIRIMNRDVFVNVAFWQRLLEGLEKLQGDHPGIAQYVKELHQMIDTEIRSWTEIDSRTLTFDDGTVLEQIARMYNGMKAARRWRKKEMIPDYLVLIQ